jgi:hypothetical protein
MADPESSSDTEIYSDAVSSSSDEEREVVVPVVKKATPPPPPQHVERVVTQQQPQKSVTTTASTSATSSIEDFKARGLLVKGDRPRLRLWMDPKQDRPPRLKDQMATMHSSCFPVATVLRCRTPDSFESLRAPDRSAPAATVATFPVSALEVEASVPALSSSGKRPRPSGLQRPSMSTPAPFYRRQEALPWLQSFVSRTK